MSQVSRGKNALLCENLCRKRLLLSILTCGLNSIAVPCAIVKKKCIAVYVAILAILN